LGLTDIESNTFGTFYPSFSGTEIVGSQTAVSSSDPIPDYAVYFYISPSTAAPASYTIGDFGDAYLRIAGIFWDFTSITFEITVYDAVGGTIEGTFSGTVQEYLGPGTMTVTDGQFKVIRAVDNAWL
jgi:hypothetical protein